MQAEVLAIEVKFKCGKRICISTCYRVGTLEDKNHGEIDKFIRHIATNKKLVNHIIVGDFNLNKTQWPEGISSNNLQTQFLDTFEDVGLTQLIQEPTHIEGNTLDLLFSDLPNIVDNVKVLEHNQCCKSDHFAITFTLTYNIKRIKATKRRIYNYTKANWEQLNRDLKYVKWDRLITDRSSTLNSWNIFKDILLRCAIKIFPK